MALSPKEREKIVEEERLRYETRQALHAEACAKHPRRGRWLWWLAAIVLAWSAWSWFACGGRRCVYGMGGRPCMHAGMGAGYGMGYHHGKPCLGAPAAPGEEGVAPGQPIPEKR